jgi:hypothetical protein
MTGGKFYAMEMDGVDDIEELHYDPEELERIRVFMAEGKPVILVTDIEDLEALGLNLDVEIVERDDGN